MIVISTLEFSKMQPVWSKLHKEKPELRYGQVILNVIQTMSEDPFLQTLSWPELYYEKNATKAITMFYDNLRIVT